jgi:hypothetical protein
MQFAGATPSAVDQATRSPEQLMRRWNVMTFLRIVIQLYLFV